MDTIYEDNRRISASRINEAFDPMHPISSELFCGRNKQVKQIYEAIMSNQGHVVLFGDRGVGKTSLAQYCGTLVSKRAYNVHYISCSAGDSFASIVKMVFSKLGIIIEKTETTSTGMSIVYVNGTKKTQTTSRIELDTASEVANALRTKEGIIVIDEFDTLAKVEEKGKFAQLMKLLSDDKTNLHLLIVGISHDVEELLGGHASAVRSLTQVFIPRMYDDELYDIIQKGEERTHLIFDDEVKEKIVKMSLGFPYYTHSLAYESAKVAVLEERKTITLNDLEVGKKEAINKIDLSLKTQYKNSIGINEALLKKQLLYCAAIIGNEGSFSMKQWTEKYQQVFGKKIENVTISSQMQQVINKGSVLLKNVKKGQYIFTNSLMPSYINILGKPE